MDTLRDIGRASTELILGGARNDTDGEVAEWFKAHRPSAIGGQTFREKRALFSNPSGLPGVT